MGMSVPLPSPHFVFALMASLISFAKVAARSARSFSGSVSNPSGPGDLPELSFENCLLHFICCAIN